MIDRGNNHREVGLHYLDELKSIITPVVEVAKAEPVETVIMRARLAWAKYLWPKPKRIDST